MTSDGTLERWDVAVALFPFTDVDARKPRPVLVLSEATFNRDNRHVVAAMITTGADSAWPSDCPITELGCCGLQHASVVRWKLFTLPVSVVARRIGSLGASDRNSVTAAAAQILPVP
jgi:mRNA-degrading endonuclease toxin of MazEF toxin-antitoxin module